MKKCLVLATALTAACGVASAQDLTVSGFLEFESHYGIDYDTDFDPSDDQVTQLDFAVDGRLNFDYSNSTKSGLEYGMHFELDLYQSDDDPSTNNFAAPAPFFYSDIATGDVVEFNDGYVFINSALGNIALGDAGTAGKASNQLNVPILPMGAWELSDYNFLREAEVVKYSNSFAGIDFEASVDDDGTWSLGAGYMASLGAADIELGLTASRFYVPLADMYADELGGSLQASIGGLTTGVNYTSADVHQFQTIEYIAAGLSYEVGALTIGAGVETMINHIAVLGPVELYSTNVFAGASYELADGLILAVGIGNLDADNESNRAAGDEPLTLFPDPTVSRPRTFNAIASVKVEF